MKKVTKWLGIAVITPILLFIILAVLIYLPPIQNWVVKKATAIASEQTGMDISIEHVNLEFPLDLGLNGFRVLHQNDSLPQEKDTIADVRKLVVDLQLMPLLRNQVIIDELSLQQTRLNTNGFVSDLRVKGDIEELWLSSKGIDLGKEQVELNGARLEGGKLDINLTDTAAIDTTTSDIKWMVHADGLDVKETDIFLHLPGDTLQVAINLGQAKAKEIIADLGKETYQVGSLDWTAGSLNYDNIKEIRTEGLDYNHLALSGINIGVDSISYSPEGTSLYIRQSTLKEKSGLEISSLTGGVRLSPDFNRLQLPGMQLRTPHSDIDLVADLDFSAFGTDTGDSIPAADATDSIPAAEPGIMQVMLDAKLGKQDLLTFMGDMPQRFIERYPNQPLSIKGAVDGNTRLLTITDLDVTLPSALRLSADGTLQNVTDTEHLKADLNIKGQSQDLNFVTAFLDPQTARDIRIPHGITLNGRMKADGNRYAANLTAREGRGKITADMTATIPTDRQGEMNISAISYDADISIDSLNLHHFMPNDSIYTITADIQVKGHGTDFLSNRSSLDADATIGQLHYGEWNLQNFTAQAHLNNGRGIVGITGHNELLNGSIGIDALLNSKRIDGTLSADISKIDLQRLRLVEDPLIVSVCGHIDITSDMKQNHHISGELADLLIKDDKSTFRPENVDLQLSTTPDTTYLRARSGDLVMNFDGSGGYERLMQQMTTLSDSVKAQFDQKIIDQPAIKRLLPTMKLHIESNRNNPIANLLHTGDIKFKELFVNLASSPETGINGNSHIYALDYDSIRIDTIRLGLTQKGDRLTYQGQIRNNRKNPQFVFNALIDGHIHQSGLIAGLRYYDRQERLGMRIGTTAEMEDEGIRFRLMPERPTIGFKEFNLNKDNYIFLASNKKIQAKVDLIADDKTGMKIYTENQDSTMLQDLTVSLNRIDLGAVTSVLPYLPKITGKLNGDYHILEDQQERFSVASDMAVSDMTFENSPIGNLSTELVYLQKEDDTHAIEARLLRDDEEFGILNGSYQDEGEGLIDATFTMNRMPLSLANGFVPDQLVGLDGYGEGSMIIKGSLRHPDVNGEIYVDSAHLVSIPYGIRMRFDNDPIRIVGSKLLLENFGLYAYNDEPLNMMGSLDFTDTENITLDLRMRARNLLLINARQEANSLAYGKGYVNMFARLQGPLDMLSMRGRLDVLGSTDLTYLLLDSPLSADNHLSELVKFTDFSDSTQTVVKRPTPTGLNANLDISISEGAHVICYLNPEQTNYVDLMGGGDLRMKYTSEGINLTGRYTLSNGEMKYSLPVIPLKTFTIKDGSYVEFTGDPMNPKLNITATERTKASVNTDEGVSRSVAFDCGVIITKTLNDMGLQFTIDAPEDNEIHSELQAMSKEENGKVAVTMLTTGMYLSDGNTGGFSMNSALSSFLQSEINNITGAALKTLDLSVGIDNTTDASGVMHTDYSFKFAKRFFDNRLKVEIGGVVSSGSSDVMGQKQSFFDNVSMEYRLNPNGTKNVKLFYKQNVYDWLEGYTSIYGGGFIWRRKLDKFWDIFTFWKKEQQPGMYRTRNRQTPQQNDSIRTQPVRNSEDRQQEDKK